MKRRLIIGFLLLFTISSTAYAANNQIVSIIVNGKPVNGSGQIIDGSTMLPIRAVAEALGADVEWDGANKQATVTTAPAVPEGLTLAELNKIGESVGLVRVYKNGNLSGTGSGFLIDNIFISNFHVIDGATKVEVFFNNDTSIELGATNQLMVNEEKDLVAYRVQVNIGGLRLNTELPKPGEKVYALGYPNGKFSISEGKYLFETYVKTFAHDAFTEGGSSGGIVIDGNGNVVGISVGKTDGTNGSHAIPASVLQEELR